MSRVKHSLQTSTIVEGHCWVPLLPHEGGATVRVGILVKSEPVAGGGRFVLIRQTEDARVYLGALCYGVGLGRQFVEIWVQNTGINRASDLRWDALMDSMGAREDFLGELGGGRALTPLFIDVENRLPIIPMVDGTEVRLCSDDVALANAGLESYSSSTVRFGSAKSGEFIRLDGDFAELRRLVPASSVALNPSATRMFARRFAPLSLWDFAALLGGKIWPGLLNARVSARLAGVYADLEDVAKPRVSGAHFFSAGRDFGGRLSEVLCLKLSVFEQCVRLAAGETKRSGLPFLNLGDESFRVELCDVGANLPFFWAFKPSLCHSSGAAAIEFPASDEKYFASRENVVGSIYRPMGWDLRRAGNGTVRLTKVFSEARNGIAIEGTLVTQEPVGLRPNELVRLRLPLDQNGQLVVFANLETNSLLAGGEIAFRSIPTEMSEQISGVLRAMSGALFSQVPYEIFLPLSSPADLFALGVMGLRVLFSGGEQPLPTIVDAAQSLLASAGELPREVALESRILQLFEKDAKRVALLGPQFLCAGTPDCLPIEIWSRVLSAVLPFFPGHPDSFARDLADAQSLAPHTAYDVPLRALERVTRSVRAVFLSDWRRNEEMAEILAPYLPSR